MIPQFMPLDQIREAAKMRVEEADKEEQTPDGTLADGDPAHPVRQPSTPSNTPAVDPGTGEDLLEALFALLNGLDADLNV
jgi:hypothetical protein